MAATSCPTATCRQFGLHPAKASENQTVQNFRIKVLRELKKIKLAWPGLNHLLRFATALRVTPHLSAAAQGGWYGRKVPFGPASTARMPRFGAWCDAIERYQMRYKITG